jgi:hypothetical protein
MLKDIYNVQVYYLLIYGNFYIDSTGFSFSASAAFYLNAGRAYALLRIGYAPSGNYKKDTCYERCF